MTELEWLAYLDRLAAIGQPTGAEIAETLGALLERLNTIIVANANRQHDDSQANARRIDLIREAIADIRTIVEDLHARLIDLEGASVREAGGDG